MSYKEWSPRQSDDEQPLYHTERRRILQVGAAAVLAGVAGCVDDEGVNGDEENGGDSANGEDDDTDGGNDDDTGTGDEDDETTEQRDTPTEVVDTYLAAALDEDTEAMDAVIHSENPFNPAEWEDDEWEFEADGEPGEYDAELVTNDGDIEDVFAIEAAEFWFDREDVSDLLEDSEVAVVEVNDPEGYETGQYVLVTEDGEWRVFLVGEEDDIPDDPEEAFDPEILDEDEAVVAEIDWDFEQDDEGFSENTEWAQVALTDDPGIEADRIRIESTIDGSEFEFYGEEPNSWSGNWANISLHGEGDQIVVTAIQDGEEEIVHREHYRP